MFPSNLEYLFLLAILGAFTLALFPWHLKKAARTREFWLALSCYLSLGFALDLFALRLGWWVFSVDKTCGITLAGVPVEEFGLFTLIYLLLVGAWEFFDE